MRMYSAWRRADPCLNVTNHSQRSDGAVIIDGSVDKVPDIEGNLIRGEKLRLPVLLSIVMRDNPARAPQTTPEKAFDARTQDKAKGTIPLPDLRRGPLAARSVLVHPLA